MAAYLHRRTSGTLRFFLLVGATLLYVIGALGVTMGANVPLNDTLAGFSLSGSTPQQAAMARAAFEGPWNTWHLIRTVTSIGALVLVIVACFSPTPHPMPSQTSQKR